MMTTVMARDTNRLEDMPKKSVTCTELWHLSRPAAHAYAKNRDTKHDRTQEQKLQLLCLMRSVGRVRIDDNSDT